MRHPISPRFHGALTGLGVVATAAMFLTVVLLVFGPFGLHKAAAQTPAQSKPIVSMTNEELATNLGEPAGTIDCAVALTAAGVDVGGQKLTGLVWDQGASQGRLIIACSPS